MVWRQKLLCEVTGRRGWQGGLGERGRVALIHISFWAIERDGAPQPAGPLASRRPFCPGEDRSLLAGICSPEKVGSQVITLARNGVRS